MDKLALLELAEVFMKRALDHKLAELFPQLNSEGLAKLVKAVELEMLIGKGPGSGGFTKIANDFGLTGRNDAHRLTATSTDIIATMVHYGTDIAKEHALELIEWSY